MRRAPLRVVVPCALRVARVSTSQTYWYHTHCCLRALFLWGLSTSAPVAIAQEVLFVPSPNKATMITTGSLPAGSRLQILCLFSPGQGSTPSLTPDPSPSGRGLG